jgi:hypothetical protein
MPNETAQAPVAAPASPAPAPTPGIPETANNVSTQNEPAKVSTAAEINFDGMDREQLAELSQLVGQTIPRDERGKALLTQEKPGAEPKSDVPVIPESPADGSIPEKPSEIAEGEVVPAEEVPAAEPAAATKELEPEDDPAAPEPKQIRMTVKDMSPLDRKVAFLMRAGMPAERALAEAKVQLGQTESTKTEAPKTVAAAQAEEAALWSEYEAAQEQATLTMDPDAVKKANALMRKVVDKRDEIRDIKQDAQARVQQEQVQVQGIRQSSTAQALGFYPELAKADSPISKAKDDIHAALVASNDPAVHAADYPLDLARRAAKATSTPPKIPGKQVVPAAVKTVPARSVQPAKPVAPIASGAARTTPSGAGQDVAALIKGLDNPRDLETLRDDLAKFARR